MDTTVQLVSNDQKTSYGFADVNVIAPGIPQVLAWRGKAFVSLPQYGNGVPIYAEVISQFLPDGAVDQTNPNTTV